MTLSEFKPHLRNDTAIDDEEIYNQHANLISNKNYSNAALLLQSNDQIDACTASLLNNWEQTIVNIENYFVDREFYDPYFYSQTEPSGNDMADKVFWQETY